MPRLSITSRVLVSVAFIASLSTTGCTALGFGIGAAIDVDRGKGTASRLESVHKGTKVTVWLRDGGRVSGRFLGYDPGETAVSIDPPAGSGSSPAPAGRHVLLEMEHETRRILVADVDHVSVPVSSGKVKGLLIGASLDAIFVLAFLQALDPGSR